MKIAVGCDHRGFFAKEKIKQLLQARGVEVVDFGTNSPESCDYPDTAFPAAEDVAKGACERGILFCGTGIGMSISANKVRGIRASLCFDEMMAEMARHHNDANVLCLPVNFISDEVMTHVVNKWLDTPFDGGRHERRISKISEFESRNGHPH